MGTDGGSQSIDGFSVFGLVVVLLAMIPVIFPINIPLGKRFTRVLHKAAVQCRLLDLPRGEPTNEQSIALAPSSWSIVLDLTSSPPIGVFLLLITTTINRDVLRAGIIGEGDSKPYDVLVLFICLAYIATALDSTGALRSLAFWVSNKSNGSGPQLYFILYCFFFVFGIIFGNDPIILSGTAFLTYFLKHCGITNPTAWIFMEFVASNIASAVLVSSNPTNVLLAQAFDLNFLTGFTKFTILPSLVTAIMGYIILYTVFKSLSVSDARTDSPSPKTVQGKSIAHQTDSQRAYSPLESSTKLKRLSKLLTWLPRANYIPEKLNQPIVSPRSVLVDPQGALFHGSLMVVTLVTLVGTSFIKTASVWQVTLPAGVLALLRDLVCDIRSQTRRPTQASEEHELVNSSSGRSDRLLAVATTPSNLTTENRREQSARRATPSKDDDPSFVEVQYPARLHTSNHPMQRLGQNVDISPAVNVRLPGRSMAENDRLSVARLHRWLVKRLPVTSRTVGKLPLPLLPFAMSMFILISSLDHLGWVHIFARWLAAGCTTPARTVHLVGFLGTIVLCPFLGTNIGATILLVKIISDEEFQTSISDPKIMRCAIFGAAMASNIGAFSLTIPSSLAGLLWVAILKQKDILISKRAFCGWNLVPVLCLSLVSLTAVWVEVVYLF